MRFVLLILIVLCTSSCLATSADLYDLADEFRAREQGLTTDEQLIAAIDAKGAEIEERAKAIAGSLPTSAGGWLGLLGSLGFAMGTTGVGVNAHRNRRRKQRKEPTGSTPKDVG